MAAARIFLFGSRDVWFVVGLPVFLYGFGWKYMQVAGFVAFWTIAYGAVQALAPAMVTRSQDGSEPRGPGRPSMGRNPDRSFRLAWLFCCPCRASSVPTSVLVIGLLVFGFVFAVISSAHSYLILAYAGSEKAAEDVGFYYAANAAGRLIGILLSGVLTQGGGMQAYLWGSAIMLALCLTITLMLPTGVAAKRVPA